MVQRCKFSIELKNFPPDLSGEPIVVSYFTGKAWLDQFAETIDMNALYFVGTALVIIALIVVCVVVRAWRIANENPVKSIKVE